jgi:hypothetical protein
VAIIEPDLASPLSDYLRALEQALDSPLGAERLESLVGPGSKVAIVVDDPSRWTPVREALPRVLDRVLRAGVRRDDVTISVGVGRHHAVDSAAMERRVGGSIAEAYRCFSPPVDDLSAYTDLGPTAHGVPVRVFTPVAAADLRILIGSVLPHLQAGFGGGYKLIFPGTSHRTTLGALHRHGLEGGSDAGALLGGDASASPMRRAIREAALKLGPCWSISHLIGRPAEVFRVVAGDPDGVQEELAAEARRRFRAPEAPSADLIVVSNHPWPGDPMQSFKVLLHHRYGCRPKGVMVGLFWTDETEIDRSFPMGALRTIAATGELGGWAIRRLLPPALGVASATGSPSAFMMRWARELVVDRSILIYSPLLQARLGPCLGPVRLFGDQGALWRVAVSGLQRQRGESRPLQVRIYPHGGLTYVAAGASGQ